MSADETPIAIDLAREGAFRLGALEVRPSTREVVLGDRREVLEPRIMQVLVALARHRGEVVSRDGLVAACWGGRAVSEDAINRAVAGVRRIAETFGGFTVETVARVGYRLAQARFRRTRFPQLAGRKTAIASAAALVVIVAAAAWLLHSAGAPTNQPTRVAVLPFDVLDNDAQDGIFANALLDTLVGSLSANQVEAASRTESAALRGPNAQREIDRLGVGLVLDGDIRRVGDAIEVRVHLDDARAHMTLWSRSFQRPQREAEALHTQIAARVTHVASWAASPGLDSIRSDPNLVAAYLEGLDELLEEGGGRALPIARQVVARAPGSPVGHLLLSAALMDFSRPRADSASDDQQPQVAEAQREAKKAIAIAPHAADGYVALANATPLDAWLERDSLCRKALSIDPGNPGAASSCSWFLFAPVGRIGESVVFSQRSLRSDPFSLITSEDLAIELAIAGRTNEATETITHARRLWPEYWELPISDFVVAELTPPYDRALALLDDPAVQAGFSRFLGQPGLAALYRIGLTAKASGDARRETQAAGAFAVGADAGTIDRRAAMGWLSTLDDIDGAFRQADLAYTPHGMHRAVALIFGNTGSTITLFSPSTAAMRRDPRFMPLVARLGLVRYWRQSGHWPDFCAEPGLPYDCKAEAAKYAGLAR